MPQLEQKLEGDLKPEKEINREVLPEKPEEISTKFPSERQRTILEKFREIPKSIRALGFVFLITTSATALEKSHYTETKDLSPKEKIEYTGQKGVCTEKMCEVVIEKTEKAIIGDLREFLAKDIGQLDQSKNQGDLEEYLPYLQETYNFIKNKNPEQVKRSPEIKRLCDQIEIKLTKAQS
jgi:hypothetical protein